MLYYFFSFIEFKQKGSTPDRFTSQMMTYEEAREEIEANVKAAEFVDSPFFVMKLYPVAEGNQKCIYKVSHSKEDKEAI